MDLQKSLKQAWDILLLKEPTMQTVAKDPEALTPAFVILGVATLISSLGSLLFPTVLGLVTYRPGLLDIALQLLISIPVGIGILYATGYLAEQLFHSKLSMNGYVAIMGHATLVNALGIFPPLTGIAGLWSLVVMCVVLNRIGKMQAGSIILLILMEALVFGALGMALVVMGVGTGSGNFLF